MTGIRRRQPEKLHERGYRVARAPNQTVNPRAMRGTLMEIRTLDAMSEGPYLSLLLMAKVVARIAVLLASASFAIYLAGIA